MLNNLTDIKKKMLEGDNSKIICEIECNKSKFIIIIIII
jgi:hypothetical protein